MKKLHTLPTLAIAAALLVPALNAEQSSGSTSSDTQAEQSMNSSSQDQKSHKMKQSGGLTGQLRRVSGDSVEREFTASDLIGKGVYDLQGEKIGSISDISVQQSLAQKFSQAAKGKSSRDLASSDTSKKEKKSASHSMMGDASAKMQSKLGGDETTVFISVGGLLGFGSDIVSAPASSLSFDQVEDRFTMNYSKEDVVALAKQKTEEYSSSAPYGTESDASDLDRTMSGSQRWSDDVSGIREALRSDDQISGQAEGIIVTLEGDKVHLSGTVSSDKQKKRAETLAKEHTKQDVKNSITVRD